MVLAGGAGVISVIGQGFPKEFSDMIRLGLNRKVDEAFRKQYLLSDCIDMILSKEPVNQTSLHSLGIAENVVRLPLVSVDESLQLRISDFVKKLINSDKEGAFFFKAKKYFVVAKLITKFATETSV
jgi:4-hydroxy-tetrahydrodipicolinate synthase